MVKRFNGFDFWEQRFKAQQGQNSEVESSSDSESDIESEPFLVDSPDLEAEA
ncbi:hypothetical protein ACLX1H_006027 [Fusarium chlamydosporum]